MPVAAAAARFSTVEIKEVHAGFRTLVLRHSSGGVAHVQALGASTSSWYATGGSSSEGQCWTALAGTLSLPHHEHRPLLEGWGAACWRESG